ncbi:Ig-like domain-containing protein, partial [Enterococcus faecium]
PNNLNVPNEEFIARQSFTNSSIMNNQNTISIDISNYLRKLIQSGEKIPAKLSFLLAITDSRLPGYDSDNAGFDAFSKEGAQKAYQDFLAGKLTLPTGQQLTEDSLAPKIVLSNVFEVKHESIEVTTEAGQAPNLPEKTTIFYSDGSQREVTVNWSEVPASSYQKEGTFTVVGRAAGV